MNLRTSFFVVMLLSHCPEAFGRTFSIYTFPSLGWEHGGRSIGGEVYFLDKFSTSMIWAQTAKNGGPAEMKQKFLATEFSYWTRDDSSWARWRVGLGFGYHWLYPEYKDSANNVYEKKQDRLSIGFSAGWRATFIDTFYVEPSIFYLKLLKCVTSDDYTRCESGLAGVRLGVQL